MKSQKSTDCYAQFPRNVFYSTKTNVKQILLNMNLIQKVELDHNVPTSHYRTQVGSSLTARKNGEKSDMASHKYLNRKRKTRLSYNLIYLHSLAVVILCTVLGYWNPISINFGAFALSSDSQMPSSSVFASHDNRNSRRLTKELLSLDLGYNVLNSEMLRQGIGFSLETLDSDESHDQPVAQSRMDSFNRHDHGDEWEDDFYGVEDSAQETLPTPQHLVQDEDFYSRGGPNPTWGGGSHSSYEGSDKFWSVSGQRSPFWFPFRPIPPHRSRPNAPKKKILVGDQGYCGTGSCEFFLFCWLGGGIVEGGCGGFLFACCHRSGQVGADVVAERDHS